MHMSNNASKHLLHQPDVLLSSSDLLFVISLLFSCLGITVDKFGLIYFVDGTMIRRIDQNGIISTMLGSNDLTSARPLSCDSVMDISQVSKHVSNQKTGPVLPCDV